MTITHRGHTIDVHRAKSLGGETLVYFSVFRDADGYECTSGFSAGSDTVRTWIKMLRDRIDEELATDDPWEELGASVWQTLD